MKKLILILTLLLSVNSLLTAQETVSSAGEQLINNQAKVNFTIGEPVIYGYNLNGNTILNGYQQPFTIELIDNISTVEDWQISVFPNPSIQEINIKWNLGSLKNLQYQLLSIEGKEVRNRQAKDAFKINISELASGNYFLKLINNEKSITYKIQKLN